MEIGCSDKELSIIKKVSKAAIELKYPCFLIGGFVRDKIIGRNSKDADFVCVGDALVLAEKVAETFHPRPHVSYFKTFGTAQLKIFPFEKEVKNNAKDEDLFEIEFVGARKESYSHNSRKPTVERGTVEEDQLRRDFTINALAIGLNEADFGKLIDPFNGLEDIKNKLIQTPLPPNQTFIDDPLRMMRAIRFASQLKFSIAADTFKSIQKNAHRIKIVSKERIADELNKIMLSETPSIGWDLLNKGGILQIIFPQMMLLHGAEFIDGVGHKDNFYHTLQVLDNIAVKSNNLWLRWAALLHDIGKPPTKRFETGHGWTFHGHEVVGARMVPKIFQQLKLPLNEHMRFVQKLVGLHLRPISLTKENITDSAIRRLLYDAGENIDDLMLLCEADITSKNKQKVRIYLRNFDHVKQRMAEVEASDQLRNWQPPISGDFIMEKLKIPAGKNVGIIKDAIREAILDGIIQNDFEAAFEYMLLKANEIGLKVPDELNN